ncbi:tRNA pseudouridine(55) synthase TruB [Candidatus Uhrbacteria bacterium]|nr:tRNA pseudouridine(55) synthase TruB [Candidatus Uhrbacteria bacterium]
MEKKDSGFLLVDKPAGLTSHDVVDRLRRITGIRKIGHAGTLDPFATGLLVVGIGREATKRLGEMTGKDKTYEAVAVLGAVSDTQDLTGEIVPTVSADGLGSNQAPLPTEKSVREAAASFLGQIEQVPPMYSAKKIRGKRLYELAREGRVVERKPVQVTIHELEITGYEPAPNDRAEASCESAALLPSESRTCEKFYPRLSFRTKVSAGTYIRTLAHDLGQKLGCGAYLESLRRTRSGDFDISQAVRLEDLTGEDWLKFMK